MKIKTVHSIAVCLVAFALSFLMTSCGNDDDASQGGGNDAKLYIKIATIDNTLAKAGEKDLLDNEKMHSVRIIVLHENGTVEHNRYYSLDGAQEYVPYVILPVTASEKKTVYVFANEESVGEVEGVTGNMSLTKFFDSYIKGTNGFKDNINNIYYTPDYSDGKNIAMSCEPKEVEIGASGTVKETFYVVRVATKFTVNFKNLRPDAVKVENFSIKEYADKNFLMAHVGSYPQSDTYSTWVDWLRAVSDASSVDDSYAQTDAAGWLTEYDLPAAAAINNVYTYNTPINVTAPSNGIIFGTPDATPVFYLPESKSKCDEQKIQHYTLTVKIDGVTNPFECELPNLKSLFRNTHVVIDVTCKSNGITTEIFVRPWNVIEHEQIVL